MRGVLPAFFAKLFETKLFFDFFLVAKSVIVHFLANFAPECHEIVLRHKKFKIKKSKWRMTIENPKWENDKVILIFENLTLYIVILNFDICILHKLSVYSFPRI
ncbi:MAG: hypothetical protein UX02_C0002G0206 [Candidatus Moranbacteria bacterium GW2011_GWC1_45_18]|nr:MAG: hypothetical protein UT79_C0001G0255 [Candidatus Moranbacteria bacterium GW2011_GWC2_40_12]KKT32183.1 MAG: hypothetical protein UW19_C0029G0005 [Candidatus Moranbacteria bacterium GW2011_GWF2_44_10]KKT72230.1 MAG: hypothetical protein UW66_C0009G0002 [Candidatus Moranbacteria bacterium GW2011_GWF1_44_4]KKT99887.1 MAG: hypothetical protein UX02_C0002G0206 [Candidatus Moranbacteria bacterium GW2011_GWC1_45_18]OGI24564.1 MAG: hypothetical protein A2194_03410 [Candidatus Moranbacteria bacte